MYAMFLGGPHLPTSHVACMQEPVGRGKAIGWQQEKKEEQPIEKLLDLLLKPVNTS